MTQPRKDPKDECRAAFEREYRPPMVNDLGPKVYEIMGNGQYFYTQIQHAWEGFQAAYAMPRVDELQREIEILNEEIESLETEKSQLEDDFEAHEKEIARLKAAMQVDGGGENE